MAWKHESFKVATERGIVTVNGATYKGLGMYLVRKELVVNVSPALMGVVHLGSGHLVNWVEGTTEDIARFVVDLARITEWDFDGLDGWQNRDPDFEAKVRYVQNLHKHILRSDNNHTMLAKNPEQAKAIAIDRW